VYAAELGVSVHTLRGWESKLKREVSTPPGSRGPRAEDASRAALSFVEVVRPPPEERDERFELVVSGGRRIVVPASFDPTALRRLIGAVESAS